MTDEEVIRRRLLIDGDGTGDDRRLNNLLKGIIKWSNSSNLNQAENEIMHHRLMAQLAQCEFPARQALILNESNKQQLEDYKIIQEDIEESISTVKETIERNKVKLEKAKVLKGNRMQYDLLAQSIQEHPTRAVTQQELSTLGIELDNLKEELKCSEEVMDKWRQQFFALSSSANRLMVLLKEDYKKNDETINSSLDDITNSPGPEVMSE